MEIRPANQADVAYIVPMFWQILEDMQLPILHQYPKVKLTNAIKQAFATEKMTQNATIYVARENNQVVGMAFGYHSKYAELIDRLLAAFVPKRTSLYDDDDCSLPQDEWYLDSLYIKKAFRKRGIAHQLLNACLKHTKKIGASSLGLDVDFSNKKAQQVYYHYGFKKTGIMSISNHSYYHLQKH